MKKIYKFILLLTLIFSVKNVNSQMGCLQPPSLSLGVFDGSTGVAMSSTIPCTYVNLVNIYPNPFAVGNNATSPCMRIIIGLTNPNAATNNSIAIGQGTNTNIYNMCPVACNTIIPSSSSYTMSLFFLDPSQSHGYNLCNTNIAANMNYTVTSCYNNVPITSGVWNNSVAGGCQTVTIPANTPIGSVGYTVSPAVVSTASYNANQGDLFLDTYQMAQGIYTITYSFNSQNGCTATTTKTISITNPYVSTWTAVGPLCANGVCVNLPPQITGTAGGTFTAPAGVSSNSFCPSLVGAGSWPVTYTVGITPQCGSSTNNTITVNAIPIANAGSTQSLTCSNTTTILSGSGGGTYSWTGPSIVSGNTSANPVVGGAGIYSLTVSSGGCTSATSTVAVGFNTVAPVPTAGTSASVTCTNSVINLTSNPASMNYTWTAPGGSSITGGVNNQNTTGSGPGTYTVRVVNPANGCFATTTVAAQINTVAPVTLAGTTGSITCNNTSINLTNTLTGVTYTWTAPGGSSITGGANSQNTTGSGAGTYSVKVQSAVNGCTAQATVAALINTVAPVPSASTSSSVTCSSSAISFTALPASGVTYTWTAPAGGSITGGVNAQITTGSGPGTYTVRVTDAVNGCTAQAVVVANINTVAPVGVTANATSSITCTSNTLNLNGAPGSGGTYTWVAPSGSSITGGVNSQNATGSGPGTYTLIFQSSVNGCTAQATAAALFNTVAPVGVTASATSSITCASQTFSLSGAPSSGGTYTWTAPAGSSITGGVNNGNTTGSGPGTYTVIFQSSVNGCTAQATASAPFNTVAPTGISAISSGTVTCASSAVNLGVTPTGLTYSWTAPAGSSITSGGTSSSATGSGGGTYSVVVTGTNGCSAPAAIVVANTNTTAPTQTAIASQSLTCSTSSLNILGNPSSGVLYSWLGTGIVGPANTQSVNVVLSGNYTLVVTSTANSCTSSAVAAIGTNTTSPSALGSGSVNITCATPSVTLIGSANPSSCTVVWTGGVCAGATSYTATACSAGTYSMTVTNPANGCSSTPATFTVVPDAASPTATLANTATITCLNTSAQIIATPTTTAPVTYTWSGPGIVSGSNTSTITVNQGGVYTLTLTNILNSCTSIITNSVTNDNAPVTPTTAASSTITCNTTTVNMTATVGAGTYTYNWSGPGIVGTNTLSSATSSLGGTYTVIVTNTTNGCVGTETLTVNSSTTVPTGVAINPPTFTLSCSTPTTALTATAVGASTYSWIAPATGAIISGGTSATAGINGPGNYSVVVTGTNGCSAAAAISAVSPNTLAPTFVLSNSSPSITCLTASPTVSINVTSTVGIGSYSWSPSSGISGSATGSVVTFTTAGTYTGVITATNGCQSNAIVTVASATNSPTFVAGTATASPLSCSNPTTIISPVYTPTTDITFVWSGPGIVGSTTGSSVAVNQNGTYSVIVTNTVTGCSSNSLTVVVVGTTIPPLLNVSSTSSVGLGCSPTNSTNILTANATPTNVSYNWNTSATTPTILVTTAGVYTVIITDPATSCTTSVTYTVDNNTTVPTATSVATSVIPCGASTATLNGGSPDPGVIFSWTGPSIISGSNTSTPVVDQPGTYILTVTNPTTGCTSTSTVTLINGVPTASFTPDVTTGFAPQVVNFTNLSSPSATVFTWTFGDGNSSSTTSPSNTYSVAGSYTVMMIASSGLCSDTAYAFITIEDGFSIEIPNVFTPNDDNVNDVFTIKSTGVKEIQLQVFNRWGQLMYDFTGAKAAWDGITSNGEKATDGTYFYFVIATGFDSTKEPVKKNGSLGLYR